MFALVITDEWSNNDITLYSSENLAKQDLRHYCSNNWEKVVKSLSVPAGTNEMIDVFFNHHSATTSYDIVEIPFAIDEAIY